MAGAAFASFREEYAWLFTGLGVLLLGLAFWQGVLREKGRGSRTIFLIATGLVATASLWAGSPGLHEWITLGSSAALAGATVHLICKGKAAPARRGTLVLGVSGMT